MVRIKKRYFVLHIESQKDIEKQFLSKMWNNKSNKRSKKYESMLNSTKLDLEEGYLGSKLRDLLMELHGDYGIASASKGLRVLYSNCLTGMVIIQCRHGDPHRFLASCLPFLTKVKNENVVSRLIYTGATVRHSYKAMVDYQKKNLQTILSNLNPNGDLKEILEQKITS